MSAGSWGHSSSAGSKTPPAISRTDYMRSPALCCWRLSSLSSAYERQAADSWGPGSSPDRRNEPLADLYCGALVWPAVVVDEDPFATWCKRSSEIFVRVDDGVPGV